MEQAQLAPLQIPLAAMGIEQLTTGQIQGHGVDAEVAAGQVVAEGTEAHQRVFRRLGVGLGAGGGHIQQHGLPFDHQLQLHRAVGAVFLGSPQGPGGEGPLQPPHEIAGAALHHQVQIGHPPPGVVVHPMQEEVAHGTAHQGQAPLTGHRLEHGRQGGGNAGNVHA